MGWTDERVELLKKLWLEGLSASQIAKQLGGVTRNAVIGKVHRLGLSGRATPSQPSRPTFKTPRPPRPISHADAASARAPAAAAAGAGLLRGGAGLGDRADAGRPHVQVADRRSGDRQLHLLRPPFRRRRALLRRTTRGSPTSRSSRASARPSPSSPARCAATSRLARHVDRPRSPLAATAPSRAVMRAARLCGAGGQRRLPQVEGEPQPRIVGIVGERRRRGSKAQRRLSHYAAIQKDVDARDPARVGGQPGMRGGGSARSGWRCALASRCRPPAGRGRAGPRSRLVFPTRAMKVCMKSRPGGASTVSTGSTWLKLRQSRARNAVSSSSSYR